MACHYDFLVVRHADDGVQLAMRIAHARTEVGLDLDDEDVLGIGQSLPPILMTCGGATVGDTLGHTPGPSYPGLWGLLHRDMDEVAIVVTSPRPNDDGADPSQLIWRVVLPAVDPSRLGEATSSALERCRSKLDEFDRVPVVVSYDRLDEDLPPLLPGDRLMCCWEVRDPLDRQTQMRVHDLGERLIDQPAAFQGLRLYTRSRNGDIETLRAKASTIAHVARLDRSQLLVRI